MADPATYMLRLTFDARQVVDALHFDIREGSVSKREKVGEFAGTYCMNRHDTLGVEIVALHDKRAISKIKVLDLTLVCSPAAGAEQPDLSPYDTDNAGFYISKWKKMCRHTGPDGSTETRYAAKRQLTVTSDFGQWQIAGYLSAKIRRNPCDPPICRVYIFDPIVVVRGGGGMP